jgi:hypothetical protein
MILSSMFQAQCYLLLSLHFGEKNTCTPEGLVDAVKDVKFVCETFSDTNFFFPLHTYKCRYSG